jgi:protein-tyrosine phosphatase
MIKSLFQSFRKKEESLADYSGVGIDMHSHLIPGIDDGAKSVDDSMMLIRSLYDLGFRKFYTTPHIMSDYFRNTPEIILEGLDKVRAAVRQEGIPVEIDAAAEYYIDDGFVKKLESEKLLTFGDSFLLFEISYINCPDNIDDIIFRMQVLGYKPIMAHPERYPFWFNNMEKYRAFRDQGVLLQVNINSFTGYYGLEARRTAEKMAEEGLIDLLGTDCHHMKHLEALKKGLGSRWLKKTIEGGVLNTSL